MILVIFRSRAQTLDFVNKLQTRGVRASAVNTPKEANMGCGLCAKIDESALYLSKAIIKSEGYSSYQGFFRAELRGNKTIILPF